MGRNKQKVMINLPPHIVQQARDLGLNISKLCENSLKQAIVKLETPKSQKGHKSVFGKAFSEKGLVRLPGFEPGLSAWQADVLNQARRRPQSIPIFYCSTSANRTGLIDRH